MYDVKRKNPRQEIERGKDQSKWLEEGGAEVNVIS